MKLQPNCYGKVMKAKTFNALPYGYLRSTSQKRKKKKKGRKKEEKKILKKKKKRIRKRKILEICKYNAPMLLKYLFTLHHSFSNV